MSTAINRVAIVTGASKGMGLETALHFLNAGMKVGLVARKFLNTEELKKFTDQFLLIETDLTHEKSATMAFDKVLSKFGRVDILINNCGGLDEKGPFLDISDEGWLNSFNLNLLTAVRCTKAILPHMESNNFGKIVFLSSITAVQPGSFNPHYSSMKAALINLSKHLAGVYASKGININCVSPGNIKTEGWNDFIEEKAKETGRSYHEIELEEEERVIKTIPIGRLGKASEIAKFLTFLVSENGSYFSGENFVIDGGKYRSI